MKKLLLILMSFLLVLAVNAGHADAVPDIRGKYSGSYTTVVSNCTDSSLNGTYYAVLAMNISTQTGEMFSGSATLSCSRSSRNNLLPHQFHHSLAVRCVGKQIEQCGRGYPVVAELFHIRSKVLQIAAHVD